MNIEKYVKELTNTMIDLTKATGRMFEQEHLRMTNMVAAASTQMLKPQYCNDFYFYFWHSEFLVVLQFGKLS